MKKRKRIYYNAQQSKFYKKLKDKLHLVFKSTIIHLVTK